MARICNLCGRAPREGEDMFPIRLREPEDLDATEAKELGLYQACLDCVAAHRQRVFDRSEDGEWSSPAAIPNNALC